MSEKQSSQSGDSKFKKVVQHFLKTPPKTHEAEKKGGDKKRRRPSHQSKSKDN